MIKLNIAKDFTRTPGGREKSCGDFSAEEFRENILKPKFIEALQQKTLLEINLDGGYGYAVSFLEEAFGGLQRDYPLTIVERNLTFISKEEPYLIKIIIGFMKGARGY